MKTDDQSLEFQYQLLAQQLKILGELDFQLLEVPSTESLLKIAIESLQKFVQCPVINIQIFNKFYDKLWMGRLSRDTSDVQITQQSYPIEGISLRRTETRVTVVQNMHAMQNPNRTQVQLIGEGILSTLQVQLILEEKLIGFIELGERAIDQFTREHQEFVDSVGIKICIGLRNLWLSKEMIEQTSEMENRLASFIETEDELRKRELSFESIVEDQTEMICRYDANFLLKFVNRAYATFSGKQPDEMIGANILAQISEEDRVRVMANVQALNKNNPICYSEHQSFMPDGTVQWHQWRDSVLLDVDGNALEYQGVGRDITAQKLFQTKQEQQSNYVEQMRQFLQATLDALAPNTVVLDQFGTIVSANAPWKNYAIRNGVTAPDYFVGTNYLAVCDNAVGEMSDGAKEAAAGIRAVISGEKDRYYFEYGYSIGDLAYWFGMNISSFDEPAPRHVVISHIDVSERKLAELAVRKAQDSLEERVNERTQELQRTKNRVEAILNSSSDSILLVKPDLSVQQTNLVFNAMFACSADDFYGRSILELVDRETWGVVAELVQQDATRDHMPIGEVRAKRKDGSTFDAEFSIGYIGGSYPYDKGLVCTIRDITERKRTQEALRKYTAELDDLYNNAPCGYHSLDENGIFVRINNTGLQWLGYSRSEVVNKLKFSDILTPKSREVFLANFPDFKRRGFAQNLSFETVHRDGHIIPMMLSAVAIYDDAGQYVMDRATFYDMTALQKSQDALRHSEEKFRMFIEAAPVATIISDDAGKISLINQQTELLFGYHPDELIGKPIEILLPENFRKDHVQHRASFMANPHTRSMGTGLELFAQRKDTTKFPVEVELSYVETQEGMLVMAYIVDITGRRERELQLRYSASMQENITDAVISTDLNFVIQSWNRAAERIYGWRADEVKGKPVTGVLLTEFPSELTEDRAIDDFFEHGFWTNEVTQRHKDGHLIHILSSTVLFKDDNGHSVGVVAMNHDISERKRAEEILRVKTDEERIYQNYLKELHEITIELMFIERLDDFYKHAVEVALKRLGFERLGLLLYDAEHNRAIGTFGTDSNGNIIDERDLNFDPAKLTGILSRTLERTERFSFDEDAELYSNFEHIGNGWNAAAILWNGKQSLGWLAADNAIHHAPSSKPQLDILALYALTIGTLLGRKQVEATLRQSEASLASVMNSTSVGIILVDREGVIRLANQLAHDYCMWIYKRELKPEITSVYDLAESREATEKIYRQVFAGERITTEFSTQVDTGIYSLDIRYDPVITSDDAVIGAAVSFINITEYKRAEDALRLAVQKEHELGELKSRFVSMASHEFRTPLASIFALSETLSAYRDKMTDAQIDQRLEHIRGQVNRLKEIIEDVLQLTRLQARRMTFNPILLNLDSICREIIGEYGARSDVKQIVKYTCTEPLPDLPLDRKLIRQLITNLIGNAIKYSPVDSVISVDLRLVEDAVILTVSDMGIGIPEADLRHLFEPFHRASNVGTTSGTGLGLTITKEAVDLHDGTITVESQVGIGTTFVVTLPRTLEGLNPHGEDSDY